MSARLSRRAALFFVLAASCSRRETRAGTPARVVSLSPSTTEAMFAIGAGSALVGRSRYCDYPPEVVRLPQVGGYVDPNLEAILALRPDLVIGARGPAGSQIAEALSARGIGTFFPKTETLAEIDLMISGLGARTERTSLAEAAVRKIHERLAAVEASVSGAPKVRALLVFGLAPIVAAGPKSFGDEMLAHAGAVNVVTKGDAYPVLGLEHVLALDPDVVVNAAMAEAHGQERINPDSPGWSRLRAVRGGLVVSLSDESVLRPGPRVGDGLAVLARGLHPGAKVP